jgi:hypothetical protein
MFLQDVRFCTAANTQCAKVGSTSTVLLVVVAS